MPSSRASSRPRDRTCLCCDSCIAGRLFTVEPPGDPRVGWQRVTRGSLSQKVAFEQPLDMKERGRYKPHTVEVLKLFCKINSSYCTFDFT